MNLFATLMILLGSVLSSLIMLLLTMPWGRPHRLSHGLISLWMVLLSLIVGSIVAGFFRIVFLRPVHKLRTAMREVAKGDFSVRLDERRGLPELREIFADFNAMVQELGATEILQTDFVSNVSHEFKTPINAIEGYVTLLQGGPEAERELYIEKILFNTRRLSGLVGNILLLSKVDNQSIGAKQSVYRLDEQIRQAIVALEPAWSAKEIEFEVELDSVRYRGNESLMFHVWNNLLDNAVKFDPPGGQVRVRLTGEGERLCCTIDDSGPGLSEETKRHMYDKFYQGDGSHQSEGNGLGLALVKRILDLSGGTIEASDRPEGGCRFTVTLTSVSVSSARASHAARRTPCDRAAPLDRS